jgi:hypothetical protein
MLAWPAEGAGRKASEEKEMSQYIETSGVPPTRSVDPSKKRRWSAIAGIAVAAALVAAAVGLINARTEQAVPTAQPSVQARLSAAELVESGQESLLAQFRAGERAAQDQRYTPSNAVEAFESAIAPTATSGGWVPDVTDLPSELRIYTAVAGVGWVPDPTQLSIEKTRAERSRTHQLATSEGAASLGAASRVASSVLGITELSIEKAIADQYRAQQMATPQGIAQLRAAELPELYAAQYASTADGTLAAELAARFDLPAFGEVSAPSLPASVRGFEYSDEATAYHELATPVTTTYFGNSGELWPEGSEPAAVSGFEYSDEATAYHEFAPPVTVAYFGNSGELWVE